MARCLRFLSTVDFRRVACIAVLLGTSGKLYMLQHLLEYKISGTSYFFRQPMMPSAGHLEAAIFDTQRLADLKRPRIQKKLHPSLGIMIHRNARQLLS